MRDLGTPSGHTRDRKWCAFDVEGDAGDKGILGLAIHSDLFSGYITDTEDALNILRQHAMKNYTLVAHNAEYDISVFFWQLHQHCESVYLNKRFNRGEWYYDKTKKPCQIWDSLGLSGGLSLKQVGIAIGLPKYDTPQKLLGIDPNKYNWICDKHKEWECEICYSVRDAEIVYTYMQSYQNLLITYQVKPKRTIGSAAVALWRSLSNTAPIHLRNRQIMEFCRQGYYGGRVECFKLGKIDGLYTSDVKSMYPSCMIDFPLPNPRTTYDYGSGNFDETILQYEGATEVTIYIPDMYVPPLPVIDSPENRHNWHMYPTGAESEQTEINSRLLFPIGTVRGIWTNCEIRAALLRGCQILDIHRAVYSEESVYAFSEYINVLRLMRDEYQKNNDPRQLTVKILLNSLYGRIGLSTEQLEERATPMPIGSSSRDFPLSDIFNVGGQIIVQREKKRQTPSPYANVLWASYITARARIKLLEYMEMQGSSLVYCDTDSIFSLRPIAGLDKGFGKLEDKDYWDEAYIGAPKIYHLSRHSGRQESKAKGLPYRAWPASTTEDEFRALQASGKAKPIVLQFMNGEKMTYNQAIRPIAGARLDKVPGSWIESTKQRRHVLQKRRTINPEYLVTMSGYSDSEPLSFGIDGGTNSDD